MNQKIISTVVSERFIVQYQIDDPRSFSHEKWVNFASYDTPEEAEKVRDHQAEGDDKLQLWRAVHFTDIHITSEV